MEKTIYLFDEFSFEVDVVHNTQVTVHVRSEVVDTILSDNQFVYGYVSFGHVLPDVYTEAKKCTARRNKSNVSSFIITRVGVPLRRYQSENFVCQRAIVARSFSVNAA